MPELCAMLSIRYAPTFVRMYKKLPSSLREEVREKIELFQNPDHHMKLKVHKLQGNLENTYAFSVNYKVRIVFEYDEYTKHTVNMLLVGNHDGVC